MTTIETLREFRIFDYAIFDFVASFIGVYLLAPILSKLFLKLKVKISRKSWLLLTLPISILTHLLSGNMTLMTENFFDLQGHYILKIIIITLLILGLKDIKFQASKKTRI